MIGKRWKQLNCLSVDEWIKKMWSSHAMEYYAAIKINEVWQMLQHDDCP